MLPIWSSCRFLLSACLLYGEHITNNPTPTTLWKIFLRLFRKSAVTGFLKRALPLKICLNMEKQRFKPCLNLCQPQFHLWNYQRILRIKNCRTHWDDWLFCHFIYSVRQSWQGHKDLNPEPTVLETAALPIELYPYIWWAFGDSNPGPTGYEPAALTNWAKGP